MLLKVNNIDTYYGLSHILQGVSLEVKEKEIVTLVGRNGAGKTTTLKSILGLAQVRAGSIEFDGQDISRLPTHQVILRGISYVPEERRIIPGLSVRENIKLALLKSHNREREEEMIERVAQYFPVLKERLNQDGTSLSGGEQQMLAIARALVTDPKVMLIDEPTEGLMPLLVESIAEIVLEINRSGVTVLLVEQNIEMALSISHRAYVIDEGRIQTSGLSQDILADEEIQRRYLSV
ncbi:MAG: ABC transporter ATP-binding protein [Desulfarculus sp.]|jgi:branched-chain amino acid transport system ATP-binding protein|nr:MAG: ABC transporter ATP-binding protein [Desulfarculus sp.]